MKTVFALVLFLAGNTVLAQHDLEFFRSSFHSSQSEEALDRIIETVPQEEDEVRMATIMAYKAVSETMKADHKIMPHSKLQQFNTGKEKLEAVIARHPTAEIRYLRLLVQLNVPGFINYNDNIVEDLSHLAEALRSEKFPQQEKVLFIQTLSSIIDEPEYLNMLKRTNG